MSSWVVARSAPKFTTSAVSAASRISPARSDLARAVSNAATRARRLVTAGRPGR
ncbi:hypothetical protein [Dactylosporangium sp. NPDC049140]|uniref:hypothetical protein n=1 Tax=Dactylosporangium sp. NPDC049140 TaxID=3155647 RepID=UPI0033C4EE6E